MTSLFRILVVASAVLAIAGHVLPYVDAGLYDPEVADLRAWDGFKAIAPFGGIIQLAFGAADVVLPALLCLFVSWARRAYLIYILITIAAGFVWGIRVSTPLEGTIWYAVSLVDGAILAMAYLTSVASRFERVAAQQGAPGDGPRPADSARA